MEKNKQGEEEKKDALPNPTPGEKEGETKPKTGEDAPKDIDFENTLKELEKAEGEAPKPKPKRSEKEKATFTFKSTAKRLKELGVDPSVVLQDGSEPQEEHLDDPVDENKFVTKLDLARIEASKLAKSESELKVIMHYVGKGLSVQDAHLLANKGKIQRNMEEITRKNNTPLNKGGGGAGGDTPPPEKLPSLDEKAVKRMQQAGMVFDETTKAYTGQVTRLRAVGNTWVSERKSNGKWIPNNPASTYEEQ